VENSRSLRAACVIDTDIAIDFLNQRKYAGELLQQWAGEGLLIVSTVTHLEIYRGTRTDEEECTAVFLDRLVSIPVDVSIARRAGALLGGLRRQGKTVGIADAIIAATALGMGVPLLTNNVEHYVFPGLKLVRGLAK